MERDAPMARSTDVPGAWDLQRQIERVDADRRADLAKLEQRHASDKAELLSAMEKVAVRLESAVRESAGVPLSTWKAHNRAVDLELTGLRSRVESVQRIVVGTLLTMIAGGVAVAAASSLGG